MRILLIEDDPRLCSVLDRALRQEGWTVEIAQDGPDGARALKSGGHDLAILDLGLPGRDGMSVLQEQRQSGSTLPILILTGRDAVEQRVAGLNAGADDYIVKPFALDELIARVRSVARRIAGGGALLRYADVVVNPELKTAVRNGKNLDLRPREYGLLKFFMENPERTLSRARIYEKVWESRYDGATNVIEVYVRYLRTALEAHGSRLVHTVRGRGYEFRRENSA